MKRLSDNQIRALRGGTTGLVSVFILSLVQRANNKAYSAIFATLIAFGVASLLAVVIGNWYVKRETINTRFLMVLSWLNLLAWIVPFFGFFISLLTNQVNAFNEGSNKKIFRILSIMGILLSLLHFILRAANVIKLPY